MSLLTGKRALILGVANERSIAWGIAQKYFEQGAQIGFTYINEAIRERIEELIARQNAHAQTAFLLPFDANNDHDYTQLGAAVAKYFPSLDIMVHSLAYARKEDLSGPFHKTDREGFNIALDISAYSLIGLANALMPLFRANSSIISMTYHGSQQVLPSYKVMGVAKAALEACSRYLASDLGPHGIRVNAISAGPIRTLAASAVGPISRMMRAIEERAPLRRNVTPADIGNTALYLASDLSTSVTGQIIYVDSGASIQAMDEFTTHATQI